jgi:hypothetical protein
MLSAILIRVSTIAIHSMMGGMAVFCLYYAAQIPDANLVRYLLFDALKWGGLATIVLYCQEKYLDG